jgi:integrase
MNVSCKAYVRFDRPTKIGEYPIYLRLTLNRKMRKLSLGVTTSRKNWDKLKELPKKSHPLFFEIKSLIEKKKNHINSIIWNSKATDSYVSIDSIMDQVDYTNRTGKIDLIQYISKVIEDLTSQDRIGYANVFRETKRQLMNFINTKELAFGNVDHKFIMNFESWINKRKVKPNTVFLHLRTLKTLINYAKKEGIVSEYYNPFKDISFRNYRKIKTRKLALSKKELDAFKNLLVNTINHEFDSKNYYLFSYYCRGINFIDLALLKWSNFRDGKIIYVRRKTKGSFIIGIPEAAIDILNLYKDNYANEDDYIFPILNETHKTTTQKKYRIAKILKSVNKDLKTFAKRIDYANNLTFNSARHTFATISKRSGISTSIISEAMGHQSEMVTKIYLDSFDQDMIDSTFKEIL